MKLKLIFIFLAAWISTSAQPKEELKYHMRYGFFRGGEATLSVEDTTYEGKEAIHLLLDGNTVGVTDLLFKVHDVYESFVDPKTYQPYMAIRNIQEGDYKWYNEAYFFPEKDSLHSLKSGAHEVPPTTIDFVTSFYYMRNTPYLDDFDGGEEFSIPVFHADKFFWMRVKYLGKTKIKSSLGEKQCHIIQPRIDKGKVLNSNSGLKFYITNDKARIPVLLEFDLKVGSLKCELDSYKINGTEQIE
ncbi:DUF3108 domain-containing protein [uncultured Sunxiuqinia sp.]|uniref:DUF3108 domain-containing protein n=1 Tax=uncultured Sunxiuqinia sp. TaxID=1573825 RepID=UPI002AA7EA53|nr:DUF3108 domain-containing protein [uncultured Sunxiuqinia sp.]